MANSDQRKSTSSFFHHLFDRSSSLSTNDPAKKPFLDRPGSNKDFTGVGGGMVKKLCNSFEAARRKNLSLDFDSLSSFKRTASLSSSRLAKSNKGLTNSIRLPGTEDKVVVYFTSLRGIRRTYEDCRTVRMIFKGFRISVDERDISMDSAYRKELQSVLGEKTVSLPQVFIRGKHIGGAEEIKLLHEGGELVKILKGFPPKDPRLVCEGCGDARFVPCFNCSGSRKVFAEEEEQLRRCPECNENGLQRCPECNH